MRDIDIVIHAAAMKIIPKCEFDPFECVRTNIGGAENVVRAALRTGVSRVVAISTDKACNPINLYGASKLAAEKIFVAAANLVGTGPTRFCAVRYGNVVGSRGSVIPLFKQLAAARKPIPITDFEMTRFSITLDQAVDLVLHALADMKGREIYVPRIPSMRIVDLAAAIAPGQPQVLVGIRPGEKIHETLVTRDEARMTRAEVDCYVIHPDVIGVLPKDFCYASNTNDWWLSPAELKMLALPGVSS
jgi:UDP-N-acetylglucosamine 4,6-dehydratase